MGIVVTSNSVLTTRFSNETILKYLNATISVNPIQLFQQIRQYISKYILLKNPNAYSFLTLWVMGTYIFRVFSYFPYVHLKGEKGSGKSKVLEILKPICFNGTSFLNPTPAVIFRFVSLFSPTLFIDEVEKLRKSDRDIFGALMSILNSGFSKTGVVPRMGGKNRDEFQMFATYSPKMLAGINDIDDVLRDRVIEIHMVRRLKGEPVERYVENSSTKLLQEIICDQLYIFGLSYGEMIAEKYNENNAGVVGIDHLNRAFDVWAPIFLLATLVDESRVDENRTVFEEMVNFSRSHTEGIAEDDQTENETVKLILTISRMIEVLSPLDVNGRVLSFDTEEVYKFFRQQEEFPWWESKPWLSRQLKKLEISIIVYNSSGKTRKKYQIDLDTLNEYRARYIPSKE